MVSKKIIIALDFSQPEQAIALTKTLLGTGCRFKVGLELFSLGGPQLVERLVNLGADIFLDLKFHDIPNTVARACRAVADLGVWMINVHALGGREMLLAARDALQQQTNPPLLIAVSILTSLDPEDVYGMGLHGSLEDNVLRLARLSKANGIDGIVCSPHEIASIRAEVGSNLLLVTPGIRPTEVAGDDQKRIMSPQAALAAGSDYLVIGRPITTATDPVQAFNDIARSIG